jgi:hypothetical protein
VKAIFNWIKSNPVIVICALIFLSSLGMVVYVYGAGNDFIENMKKVNLMITEIKSIMTQRVQIPPEKPDGLPRFPTITVNQHAIDDLRVAYKKMNDEYEAIFKLANLHNQQSHIEMIEGIFPDPHFVAARPFDAKERYRQSFKELFEPYSPTAGYPQIDAKPPLPPAEIAAALERVREDYLTGNFLPPKTMADLTPQEADKLKALQAKRHIEVLQQHAKSIHIYAQTEPGPGYPFEVQGWSSDAVAKPPTNIEIWDGQMSLWIQQDICRAIQLTNKVDTPSANVMNSPVKQLLQIKVDPKYIGLAKDDSLSVDHRIPDDFSVSMSGRYCNPLYDVRHAALMVIIDSQRMPEFFNALSQVNFMTVIGMKVTDIDEYAVLRTSGAVYGPVDCVQVEFQIESIWLREWTMKLMPKEKKIELGLPLEKPPKAGAPVTPPKT